MKRGLKLRFIGCLLLKVLPWSCDLGLTLAGRGCGRVADSLPSSPLSARYRFAEIRYHRPEEMHKGRLVPARVETVVLFLPDVWSCMPSRLDWQSLQTTYRQQLAEKLALEAKQDSQALVVSYLFSHVVVHLEARTAPTAQHLQALADQANIGHASLIMSMAQCNTAVTAVWL